MKATRLDILEWIAKRGMVWAIELTEHFNFTHHYVENLLWRLKKDGLVDNMTRGCWELTEEGFRKLKYHGRGQGG